MLPRWRTEQGRQVDVLFLDGDIDLVNAGELKDTLRDVLEGGHHILVDLLAVDYLDLTALAVFEEAHEHAAQLRRHLMLVSPCIEAVEIPKTPSAAHNQGGRGLYVMYRLMDTVEILRPTETGRGVAVRMTKRSAHA